MQNSWIAILDKICVKKFLIKWWLFLIFNFFYCSKIKNFRNLQILRYAVSFVFSKIPGVFNLETIRVNDLDFMLTLIYRFPNLRFVLHSLDFIDLNYVPILVIMLNSLQKRNNPFFRATNTFNHHFLRLLTVFIQNRELLSKIVKYSPENPVYLRRDKFNTIFPAVIVQKFQFPLRSLSNDH